MFPAFSGGSDGPPPPFREPPSPTAPGADRPRPTDRIEPLSSAPKPSPSDPSSAQAPRPRHSGPLMVLLLAGLSAIGPFSIDTYPPAFPAMEAELLTGRLAMQQTLAAYMATFAFMTLWHGALSDSFGRRRVILTGMVVYAAASLVCAAAPSIHWLWLGRGLQGLSAGAGMVVARAVIRDMFEGPEAQRLMSRVMTVFAISPAVAPMVGGTILPFFGWRAIFVFLAAYGLILGLAVHRLLPETLPHED